MVLDAEKLSAVLLAEDGQIRVDPRRWLMLLTFSFQQMLDTTIWITFASIALETSDLYGVHVAWVNSLSLLVLGLFLPGMLWCSYLMTRFGARRVVMVAAALHLLAGLVRYASIPLLGRGWGTGAFALLFLGQTLSAFAQPICTNLPVRIANDWFPLEERDIATTLGNFGLGVGNVFGVGVPSRFVWRAGDGTVQGVGALLLVELVLALAGFLWAYFGFVDPDCPPSHAAALLWRGREEARAGAATSRGAALAKLREDYSALLRDRNFCLLLFAFSIGLGFFNSIFTVLEQLVHPAGYGARDAGHIGNIFILGGVVTSAVCGKVLDKTHAYRTLFKLTYIATGVATLNLVVSVRPEQMGLLCLAAALMGAACLPLLPVSLGMAAEVTFPIPEEASTGLMIFAGNTLGVIFTFAYGALIPCAPTYATVWTPAGQFTLAGIALAVAAAAAFHGDLRRLGAEAGGCQATFGGADEDKGVNSEDEYREEVHEFVRQPQPMSRRISTGLGACVILNMESYFSPTEVPALKGVRPWASQAEPNVSPSIRNSRRRLTV